MAVLSRQRAVTIGLLTVLIIVLWTMRRSFSIYNQYAQPLLAVNTRPAPVPSPFIINSKVAAIIENRPLSNLVPLILHFYAVLGPTWPIVVYTTANNTALFSNSPAFQRHVDAGSIEVRVLPDEITFTHRNAVSAFLTKPWFWEQLAPAGHVLLFQADSILCANAEMSVEDFLEYDFVGAPIDPKYGVGYNGGLSLRNRTMVLDIIAQSTLDTKFEDQWFFKEMQALPAREDGSPGARLPSRDVAKRFSVETIYDQRPLGYHQVLRWQKQHAAEVDTWCPEHRLCTERVITS